MKKRPHIIIFNPDEMRADALAHLGNPAAVTPNLVNLQRRREFPSAALSARIRSACLPGAACLPVSIPMFTAAEPWRTF